jgi:hypothetical protein
MNTIISLPAPALFLAGAGPVLTVSIRSLSSGVSVTAIQGLEGMARCSSAAGWLPCTLDATGRRGCGEVAQGIDELQRAWTTGHLDLPEAASHQRVAQPRAADCGNALGQALAQWSGQTLKQSLHGLLAAGQQGDAANRALQPFQAAGAQRNRLASIDIGTLQADAACSKA